MDGQESNESLQAHHKDRVVKELAAAVANVCFLDDDDEDGDNEPDMLEPEVVTKKRISDTHGKKKKPKEKPSEAKERTTEASGGDELGATGGCTFEEFTNSQFAKIAAESEVDVWEDRLEPRLSLEFRKRFSRVTLLLCDSNWERYLEQEIAAGEDYFADGEEANLEQGIRRGARTIAITVKSREAFYEAYGMINPGQFKLDFDRLIADEYVTAPVVAGSSLINSEADAALRRLVEMFFKVRAPELKTHKCTQNCHKCIICDLNAIGIYYNAYVCKSCKTFFENYVAQRFYHYNEKCETGRGGCVDMATLLQCSKCRYEKCVYVAKMDARTYVDPNQVIHREPAKRDPSRTVEHVVQNVYASGCSSRGVPNHLITPANNSEPLFDRSDALIFFNNFGLDRVIQFARSIREFALLDLETQNIALSLSCLEIMIIRWAAHKPHQSPTRSERTLLKMLTNPLKTNLLRMTKVIGAMQLTGEAIALLQAVCLFSGNRKGVATDLMRRMFPLVNPAGTLVRRALYDAILKEAAKDSAVATTEFVQLMKAVVELQRVCWENRTVFEAFGLKHYGDSGLIAFNDDHFD